MRKRKLFAGIMIFSLFIAVPVVLMHHYNNILHENRNELQRLENRLSKIASERQALVKQLHEVKESNRELQEQVEQLEKQVEKERANQWLSFTATYYDADFQSTGKRPGDPGYGITKSGRMVEAGVTVAVDPKIIPLGSWIEIKYPDGKVEQRRADDTGRLIKGRKIDIYLPKATLKSGKHEVQVRIIEKPPVAV